MNRDPYAVPARTSAGDVSMVCADNYQHSAECASEVLTRLESTSLVMITGTATISLHNHLRAIAKRTKMRISIKGAGGMVAVSYLGAL